MSVELIVAVGEYLGRLPFDDPDDDSVEFVDVQMLGGQLVRLEGVKAELMAFCRNIRPVSEVRQWLAENEIPESVFEEAKAEGLLRQGSGSTAFEWLADLSMVTWGRSLGWTGEGFGLLSIDNQAVQVSAVYYWIWVYARTGQPIGEVVRFIREQAHVEDAQLADEETISTALVHMIAAGFARLELPVVEGV